ncbi:pyridoxal-dependent decarboxylase, exosortase A system-associated [sulfur-oxidizing endosymbiont of Gigantopelta aegis]|uniref:pyridoxal-dependent decarboxylase, exosortase A system-associated n=1 Tax=sulfur-oxidizing endosymbiont of Gigantopelta aegis TaxID=2794934 RepID=UPI0018DC33B4|nr:pyridoxal-dependent decarboxylase, exosortase A system-associated [sulfur-oxidizing endosymbiont of Gigantopelta aegis]
MKKQSAQKKSAHHVSLNYFPMKKGRLFVGDKPLEQVVAMVGQTPLYIYDRQLITERMTSLREILPEKIQLHYAMKANPMPAVVQHLASLVDGLDVASQGEMLTAINAGMPPGNISFAGPGKTDAELKAAIAAQIVLNVESENELRRIDAFGKALGLTPDIALRVNPDFELKSSGMKMSGGAKQFGIDAELLPELLTRLAEFSVHFVGFHIFSGSQNLNSEALMDVHNKTFELAAQLSESVQGDFGQINIGGGFGIPYFPGDKVLDLQPVAENLQRLLTAYPQFKDKEIIIELGRYLVGEAGIYVSKVIDKKDSRGQNYLITDGGLHHHLSNSGNFGQVIRKNYPVRISQRKESSVLENTTVVGPLCTPLDTLANKMDLPKAEIGDLVVILQSGAYGKSASPEHFLGHPAVKELLL